jgi:insertion element IS1 protein InsB
VARQLAYGGGGKRTWLWGVLVHCFAARPDHLQVRPVACHGHVRMRGLEVAAEARASFVKQKAPQQWMGSARDAKSRPVMALHVGDRRRKRAKRLWAKMPAASRQHATFSTDHDVVYAGVMPAAPHRAISQ